MAAQGASRKRLGRRLANGRTADSTGSTGGSDGSGAGSGIATINLNADEIDQALRLAFDQAPTGIALVAPDGRFVAVNRAMCRLTGYSEADLLSRRFQDITHPDDLALDLAHTERLLKGEITDYQMDKRYLRPGGGDVWVRLRVGAATDGNGGVLLLIAHVEDITRQRQADADLIHAATHDQLTQAANRTLLIDRMDHALAASRRNHDLVGVFFCDLDRFKDLNDRLGHATGDEILRLVAARIRIAIRPGDTLARVGGDEFVVLALNLASLEMAEEVAARVQAAVGLPLPIPGASVSVSISVGCAVGGSDADPEQLLADADRTMYLAKARRRGSTGAG